MAAINETDQIRSVLERLQRSLPAFPKVVGTHFELGTDQADDPAVFIVVILDESTRDEDWTSANLEPLEDRIDDELRASGITRWPYVRFARPSEWKAAG